MGGVHPLALAHGEACRAIPGITNLVNAATHPSKHPAGHELLASFPPLL